MESLEQTGLLLNFVGALAAALFQLPWSREDIVIAAGVGRWGAETLEEDLKMPAARAVKRRLVGTGVGLVAMAAGFMCQVIASF